MTDSKIIHEVSVQEGYTLWSAQYDHEENALIALEEELTLPLLDTISVNHVLDIGTGTGRYAIRLANRGAQVVGLDQSDAMLAVAQQAAVEAGVHIEFRQHTLDTELPSEPNRFDLVLAALVLCHVENLVGIVADAYRLLRPGGHIVVTDFHPAVIAAGWRTQFTNMDDTYFLPTVGHTRNDYLDALLDAGFQIQTVQDGLVRDAPGIPAAVVVEDGDRPFCLVIHATKPG